MPVLIDALEARRLFATTWSAYAQIIGQDDAAAKYATLTGAGQTVAIIDTGVDYTHKNLGGGFGAGKKVIAGYDFVDNDSDPKDTDGHGTMVAGVIAGDRFVQNGITYQGIAPDAKLVALRAGTESGFSDANIQAALNWVINNAKKYGITVVNMSLGGGNYTSTQKEAGYQDELKKLKDLGIAVVAAAGNDGEISRDSTEYPAADPSVYAIGSINASDQISSFSERGSELDLLAPGEQITTTAIGNKYETVDGTSFSSPLVAGVFALLNQETSTLNPADMMSVLRSSSDTQYDGDGDTGLTTQRAYAQLDLVAALDLAKVRDTTANLDYFTTAKGVGFDAAYDATGVLHLAYYDVSTRKLMYSTRLTDGKWTTPTRIDNGDDVGQYVSLAVDSTGKPGVSYYDGRNQDLKYAAYNGATWDSVTLDSKGSVGQFTSLTYDAAGEAAIAYYRKTSGDLRLVRYNRNTSAWTRETIDADGDVGRYASIGYFRDDDFVTDANGNSTGVNTETLAIAYADDTNGALKYYRNSTGSEASGGGVLKATVDDISGVAHIALSLIDQNGVGALRIAYQDTKNSDVKVAYREAGVFHTKTILSSGTVGTNIDSYVDGNDTYHVVYYDKSRKATYNATISSTFAVAGNGRVGTAGSLGVVAQTPDGSLVALVGLNRVGQSFAAVDIVG